MNGMKANMEAVQRVVPCLVSAVPAAARFWLSSGHRLIAAPPHKPLQQEMINESLPIYTWTERTTAGLGASGMPHRD